ncbi:DUF664 domain-containing protein [Amycolatopsis sp. NPDC051061]|uniref:mycothiol transferase n=1 Tax=Amycolatopsis sp. NPDC051061 TaxID=3155042 RepID=UPI00344824F1
MAAGRRCPRTRAARRSDAGQADSFTWPDARTPNPRRIIVDMIEECARHADLLREAVDGLVGEDAPA